jgi:hypothetical protein
LICVLRKVEAYVNDGRTAIKERGNINETNSFFLLSLILVSAMGLGGYAPALAAEAPLLLDVVKWGYPPKFPNVRVNLVGDTGHCLKPYEFWKSGFERINGVPRTTVYEKEKTEFVVGTGAFDVVTFYPVCQVKGTHFLME